MAIAIQSVMHVNVNCSDLGVSLPFYRDFVGLVPTHHTQPVPQDGAGFGMRGEVQWDAHILHDARGFAGPAIDLLQWQQPRPVGQAYSSANHLGFFRICVLVPDLDAVYAEAEARSISCLAPPLEVPIERENGFSVRVLNCFDPDGIVIEFVERPELSECQLIHVNVNCADLARSVEWYQRVLGLEVRGESHPGPVSGEAFALSGEVEWNARFLWVPGQENFAIDLLEWRQPAPVGKPYATANHLGIYRMAFMVEDARASYDELRRQGVDCYPPVYLDMGPEIPIDGLWALFFPDPDGTCLELIEIPV